MLNPVYSDFVRMKYPERCIFGGFGCQNHTQCTMFGGWGQVNNASRLFYHPNDVVWQHCHNPNIHVEASVFRFFTYEVPRKIHFKCFWVSKSHPVHYVWKVGSRKQCIQVVLTPERCSLTTLSQSQHPCWTTLKDAFCEFGCQNHTQCTMFGRWYHVNNASRLF